MNNFIGSCAGNVGVGLRAPVTDNLSIGVTGERNAYRLTKFGYDGRGHVVSERAIADARYTFGSPQAAVRPFVEAGVGYARVTSRFDAFPGQTPGGMTYRLPKSSDSDVLGHAAAGVTVDVGNAVQFSVAGTYQMTDNLRFPICVGGAGGRERCDHANTEGRLLRTTGFERNYGVRFELSVPLDKLLGR